MRTASKGAELTGVESLNFLTLFDFVFAGVGWLLSLREMFLW